MKRAEANDPAALCNLGDNLFKAGNYTAAVDCWEKAAGLGHIHSHFKLSQVYKNGQGVQKDMKKATHHVEQAAIGGHVSARYNLGVWEYMDNRNMQRAIKHFIIAATLGFEPAIEALKELYATEMVSKEDFAAALRTHKAARDAMKSPHRDAEEAARKRGDL